MTTLAAVVTNANQGFSFSDINTLTVGTVDGVTGVTTNNGAIVLSADDMNINAAVNSGTARTTLQPYTETLVVSGLDADTTYSTFERQASVDASSSVKGSSGIYIDNELE